MSLDDRPPEVMTHYGFRSFPVWKSIGKGFRWHGQLASPVHQHQR